MFGPLEINIADILRAGLSLLMTKTQQPPHHKSMKERPMTIIKISAPNAPAAPAAAQGTKEKSQVWLNVGINIPMVQADGTTQNVFVSLPMGLALDTMTKTESRGNSTEYAHMVQAKNWLLEQIQAAGSKLNPGQAELIQGLELQIRRVGEAPAVNAHENPYLTSLSARFAAA